MAVLFSSAIRKVVELPCRKVILLQRIGSEEVFTGVLPVVYDSVNTYKLELQDELTPALEMEHVQYRSPRYYWFVAELAAAQQRIAELEAHLNTRNLAVERDGDPLREKLTSLIQRYGEAVYYHTAAGTAIEDELWEKERLKIREELDARLSGLVDIIRVLTRDNKAQQTDLRRYKAALEEIQRRVTGFVYGKGATKRDLRQIVAHISFALSDLLEGGAE